MADLGIRYATALFELSNEAGKTSDYLQQAKFIKDVLQEEEPQRVLTHPRVSAREKSAFLKEAFRDKVHEDLFNFMLLVVSKNRQAFLVPALTKLIDMINRHQNQITVRVGSAVPLTETQAGELTGMLSQKLGKMVELQVNIDPTIIAGISIHADGYFLDRTVKTMLKDLKQTVRRGARE